NDTRNITIEYKSEVIFLINVTSFFNQKTFYFFSFRACLMGDKSLTQDFLSIRMYFVNVFCYFYPAGFTTSTSMTLCFYYVDVSAKFFCVSNCFINRVGNISIRYRNTILPQYVIFLILVDIDPICLRFKFDCTSIVINTALLHKG